MSRFRLSVMEREVPSADEMARILDLDLGIEINSFVLPDRRWRTDYVETAQRWQAAMKEFSGPLSMHGAFWHLHPASTEPEVVEFARLRHTQSIEAAAIAGCHYVVLHSDVHARARAFNTGDDWTPVLAEHFRGLAREAATRGVGILIENTFETDARGLVDPVRLVDEPNVGLSLDVGHAFVSNKRPLDDWIWQLQLTCGTCTCTTTTVRTIGIGHWGVE